MQTINKKVAGYCLIFLLSTSVFYTAVSQANELQDDFAAGLEALDNDQLKTAKEIFHGILSSSPRLHRARLELARAYHLSLDYEQARLQAKQVLADPNTPAPVRASVLAFIAQIDKDEQSRAEKHQWTPSIYFGLMHDTNVNVGPESESLVFPNGAITLSPDDVEKDDTAFVVNPSIAHTYDPGKNFEWGESEGYLLWQSQASYYHRGYVDEDAFNLSVLNLGTGPVWIVPRHWRAGLGVSLDQIWLGGTPLALFSAINPNITWEVGKNSEFTLKGTLGQRDYNKSSDKTREGIYRSLGGSFGHYLNDRKMAVNVGGQIFDFDADGARFSNDGWEVFLNAIVSAWTNGSIYAEAAYQSYKFDGLEPFFLESRDDEERRFTVGFQHDYKAGILNQWTLSGSWHRTDNASNIPIYDYARDQFSIGLSRSF